MDPDRRFQGLAGPVHDEGAVKIPGCVGHAQGFC